MYAYVIAVFVGSPGNCLYDMKDPTGFLDTKIECGDFKDAMFFSNKREAFIIQKWCYQNKTVPKGVLYEVQRVRCPEHETI